MPTKKEEKIKGKYVYITYTYLTFFFTVENFHFPVNTIIPFVELFVWLRTFVAHPYRGANSFEKLQLPPKVVMV